MFGIDFLLCSRLIQNGLKGLHAFCDLCLHFVTLGGFVETLGFFALLKIGLPTEVGRYVDGVATMITRSILSFCLLFFRLRSK